MKDLKYLALFSAILLPTIAHAQEPPADCPSVSVSGPASVAFSGNDMAFSAQIEPFDAQKMSLVWKAINSDSKEILIKAGQGTRSIQVETIRANNINITATLTIQGLPEGCKNTDSETAGVVIHFLPTPVDEYGPMNSRDELARLTNVALQLKNQPESVALFVFTYPARTTRSAIETKNKEILRQLARLGRVSPDSLLFKYRDGDSVRTKIYIVPHGADLPSNEQDLDSFRPKVR